MKILPYVGTRCLHHRSLESHEIIAKRSSSFVVFFFFKQTIKSYCFGNRNVLFFPLLIVFQTTTVSY